MKISAYGPIILVTSALLGSCSPESSEADTSAPDTHSDSLVTQDNQDTALADVDAKDSTDTDSRAAPKCGNKACDTDENPINCLPDCPSTCGDGLCTFGEFCHLCPADCDCTTLGATPPMGWNTWNRFACDIDEQLIMETADALVESGMRDAGYIYLNLDDCWQVDRDENGRIIVDEERFPSGMKYLADYIHGKGLRFGVYTCAGTMTCQQKPGSFGYESIDAQTYSDWGVDYIKEDWCFTDGMDSIERYTAMADALAAVERPMILSICNWGKQDPWIWGQSLGQLWRTTGDIADWFPSMLLNFSVNETLAAYAGPEHWNDPDMLEVGNGGMTQGEYRIHMSLWAVMAAPLIAGNDLREMDGFTKELLTNPEIIAVDQDPLGIQGVRLSGDTTKGVLARPLSSHGLRAVVLYNATLQPETLQVRWSDLGLESDKAWVRDIISRTDMGEIEQKLVREVPAGDALFVTVQGQEMLPPYGVSRLADMPWRYAASSVGRVERNMSVGSDKPGDGKPLSVQGTAAESGFGVGAASRMIWFLGGNCTRFTAKVGIDDEVAAGGSVTFEVWADNERIFQSEVLTSDSQPEDVDVPLNDAAELHLVVTNADNSADGDHADWLDATIECK